MLKVGLSGNRYSGKNRVASIFNSIGVPVFEADVVLKFILNFNYDLQGEVTERLGKSYFNNGKFMIDKVKADGVFDDIINIVEPDLYGAWIKFIEKNHKSIYCIFHSSILFEREWNKSMDLNISVFSHYADRATRCKNLTGKSIETIYNQSKGEMSDLEKNGMSDYIIHNYNKESSFYGDAVQQVNMIDNKIIDDFLKREMTTKKEFAL
jgi:dephospho-CoA kinase